jgi:hypothetical protein
MMKNSWAVALKSEKLPAFTMPRLAPSLALMLLLLTVMPSPAVLFHSTADPAFNTTAPTGDLAGSGWELQGRWGSFLGTPIAPQYFITAAHVGGQVGDKLRLDGIDYETIASFTSTNSDLRIWRICGVFPTHAPLYTSGNEAGRSFVVFGRGTRRGTEVIGPGTAGDELKGWRWGIGDGVMRWGENQVSAVETDSSVGELLVARFDADGGPNEAHLSVGDSSGGVFIKQGADWKLAGINYAVDGPYNTTNSGGGFQAAIFDEGGLHTGGTNNWSLIEDEAENQPGALYMTRISSNAAWIESVLSAPIDAAPTLRSAPAATGPYTYVGNAAVNLTAGTITVPKPATPRFYRLRGCAATRITGISVEGQNLVISFAFE